MTRPTRIGLFGGSFNPPHVAHQMACLYVLETAPIDQVWMVPSYRHPFGKLLAPFEHRLAMCRLAAAPLGPRVEVLDVERSLAGEVSRTIDTLEALRAAHPDAAFRLVVGADILAERGGWHRWDDIVAIAPPIVLGRAGFAAEGGEPALADVSSTEVRARLERGESAVPLVSRAVMDYIAEQGLYR